MQFVTSFDTSLQIDIKYLYAVGTTFVQLNASFHPILLF